MSAEQIWALGGLVTALGGFVKVLWELRTIKHQTNSQNEALMARLDVALERNIHLESDLRTSERTQTDG